MGAPLVLGDGVEWVVDAFGCDPAALQSPAQLTTLFLRAMEELRLHPVAPLSVHSFPGPGGVTAVQLLSESHLTAHTFPESGYAAFNLYCCRPRPDWPWERRLAEVLGATRVEVRRIARPGRPP